MVELACETDFVANNEEFKKLAHDIAMHVAAFNPMYLTNDDINEEAKAKAKAFFKDEVDALKKPADMSEKILQGKLDTYFKEQVLMGQSFVKDPEVTIADLVTRAVQKFGEKTEIMRYTRFAVGK
jgi:elongation factor Ts